MWPSHETFSVSLKAFYTAPLSLRPCKMHNFWLQCLPLAAKVLAPYLFHPLVSIPVGSRSKLIVHVPNSGHGEPPVYNLIRWSTAPGEQNRRFVLLHDQGWEPVDYHPQLLIGREGEAPHPDTHHWKVKCTHTYTLTSLVSVYLPLTFTFIILLSQFFHWLCVGLHQISPEQIC